MACTQLAAGKEVLLLTESHATGTVTARLLYALANEKLGDGTDDYRHQMGRLAATIQTLPFYLEADHDSVGFLNNMDCVSQCPDFVVALPRANGIEEKLESYQKTAQVLGCPVVALVPPCRPLPSVMNYVSAWLSLRPRGERRLEAEVLYDELGRTGRASFSTLAPANAFGHQLSR